MRDDAAVHDDLGRGDAPLLRGGLDQHRARRRPGATKLLPGIGQARAAARRLHRTELQIVVARGVRRRGLDLHLRPVRVELLGQDDREARVASLAHLEMLADDRHRVVRRDPHERVRREHLVGREGAAPVEAESDEQRRACERGGLEESPARDHAQPPSVAAASWMAARIRTYVAHRQTLPDIAVSMSASDGRGISESSAIADMI